MCALLWHPACSEPPTDGQLHQGRGIPAALLLDTGDTLLNYGSGASHVIQTTGNYKLMHLRTAQNSPELCWEIGWTELGTENTQCMSTGLSLVQMRVLQSKAEDVYFICVFIYNIFGQSPGNPPNSVNSVILRGLANDFPY